MGYEELDFSSYVGRKEQSRDIISVNPALAMGCLMDKVTFDGAGDAELPPLWHWFYFWSLTLQKDLGADGHERLGKFLPPIPLRRRMYAGGTCEFIDPISIGTWAEKESVVKNIQFKNGSSGPLFFVTIEHRITQSGILKSVETQNLVYRDHAKDSIRESPLQFGDIRRGPGEIGFSDVSAPTYERAWERSGYLAAESPLLFRFSALTYNSHKIHYDPIWSMDEEGYQQLVVHGPLIAITLLECLRSEKAWPRVLRLNFRAISPAFVGQKIVMTAKKPENSREVSLEAAVGDRLVMSARAMLGFEAE